MRRRRRGHRDGRSSGHTETWLSGGPAGRRRRRGDSRVVLCYPSTYSLGMSNLGFQATLGLLAREEGVVCERAFWEHGPRDTAAAAGAVVAADADGSAAPAGEGVGRSLETGSRLSAFDVVAFSVSFEDDFLKLAAMLEAGGVPLPASERSDDDPIVVMGGVCAYLNSEPVAPFLDAVLVGEAEALVSPFVESVRSSVGLPRAERLRALAGLEGAYVPSLYEPERDGAGRITGFRSEAGAPLPVRAATGSSGMARSVVLSDGAYFNDMLLLEVSRGCARGCRFCAAGSVLRPRVWRTASEVVEAMETAASVTGRVGLVTAALLDHPEAAEILRGALELGAEVNVSSLRADAVTREVAELLVACGVRTATVAPETGTEDLRAIVGKPVTDEALLSAAGTMAEAGLTTLKLYFMVGLPGEREEDVAAIPDVARAVRSAFVEGRSGARVTVSVSAFVPKPRTPFQWLPMAGEAYLRDAVSSLRRAFAGRPRMEFSATGAREARREGALARGGRELAEALRLSAVGGAPWKAALRASRVDVGRLLDTERPDDEIFPWDAVVLGPTRDALLASLTAAREAISER